MVGIGGKILYEGLDMTFSAACCWIVIFTLSIAAGLFLAAMGIFTLIGYFLSREDKKAEEDSRA